MSLPRVSSKSLPAQLESVSSAPDRASRALHLVTFGCQMNKYDSERVEGRFRRAGYALTDRLEQADVVLFNTCSVRDHAEERVWSWLGELKRHKRARPDLVVGVMGCMAQRLERTVFERAEHVDLIVGTRAFQHLPEMVEQVLEERTQAAHGRARGLSALEMDEAPDGAGAFARDAEEYTGGLVGHLAIMRGCDLSCSFCIVPSVRGRVLSRPPEQIEREARWMVERGAKVLVLLGQTVNSYGEDLPAAPPQGPRGRGRAGRVGLADLLYRLQTIEGLARIRLITLHPAYVDEELARALAENDKCERFLPLPVQSGSDRMLRAMRRGYNLELYREKLALLCRHVPDLELGTDWIVGYPGETNEDFEQSERLLAEAGFAVNYVFKYSPRPGTRAHERADDVAEDVKQERNQRLLALGQRVQRERLALHMSKTQEVFLSELSQRNATRVKGHTRHGLSFVLQCRDRDEALGLIGRCVRASVDQVSPFGMVGHLLDAPVGGAV